MLTTSGDLLGKAFLDAAVPMDGAVHTVDVRDAAEALAASVTADVTGRTLLIGGDASHRQLHGDIAEQMLVVLGLGAVPRWLPRRLRRRDGDPTDETAWFCVGWMDTTEAQQILDFQHHTWAETLTWMRQSQPRWLRRLAWLTRLLGPLVHVVMGLMSPYVLRRPGPADPWPLVARKYGEQALSTSAPADVVSG